MAEISRICDHLTSIGAGALALGASTAFQYAIEGREFLWDLIEEVCGQRMMPSYARVGGLATDITTDFPQKWHSLRRHLLYLLDTISALLTRNRIFIDRMQGTGVINADDAIAYGFTGPCLRATGVDYDVRKAFPYHMYNAIDFDSIVGNNGDNYDRYLVRVEEIRQSIRIVDQCLEKMQPGPICCPESSMILSQKSAPPHWNNETILDFKTITQNLEVPPGEAYGYVEGSNGELGFYIVSLGGKKPWRIKIRPPCFYIISAIHKMVEGAMLADIIPTFDTINLISGEADR